MEHTNTRTIQLIVWFTSQSCPYMHWSKIKISLFCVTHSHEIWRNVFRTISYKWTAKKKKIIVQELSMALCISIYCFSLAASFVRSISVKCFSWRFIYIIYYIDCMNRILLDVKCSNIKHRNRLKRTKLLHRSHRMQADWLLLLLVELDFVQFASPKISQIFHLKKPHKQPVGVQCERRTNPYVNWDFAKCVNHIYIHTS